MTDTDDDRPYRLLDALDETEVPAGRSLLVTASEPAGTEFLMRLLGQGHRDGEDLLVLTTDDPAGTVTADIETHTDSAGAGSPDRMRVIDCQTDALNVDAHDEETVKTLRRAFNGVLTVSSEGEELTVQVSGLEGVSEDGRSVEK